MDLNRISSSIKVIVFALSVSSCQNSYSDSDSSNPKSDHSIPPCHRLSEDNSTVFDRINDRMSSDQSSFFCYSGVTAGQIDRILMILRKSNTSLVKEEIIEIFSDSTVLIDSNEKSRVLNGDEFFRDWALIFDKNNLEEFRKLRLVDWTPSPREEGVYAFSGGIWVAKGQHQSPKIVRIDVKLIASGLR